LRERYRCICQGYLEIAIVLEAMVLVSHPLLNIQADSRSFILFDRFPIALIRGPGFLPYPNYPILGSCIPRDIVIRESNPYSLFRGM